MSEEMVRKEFLYERIADLLEADIIAGMFPDQKLPSEQELSVKYSASRTVIREALKILGERRLVSSVVGSGAYITKPDVYDLSTVIERLINTHKISILDAIDVRIILETASASLAALNATEEEFDHMEEVCAELRNRDLPFEELTAKDLEFHMLICRASHNSMLSLIAQAMSSVVEGLISMNLMAGADNPDVARYISHTRVLTALRDRNPQAAQSVLYDHLYITRLLYENYISRQKNPDSKFFT